MNKNIKIVRDLVGKAVNQKADFIALPENAAFMSATPDELPANVYFAEEHPALAAFAELSQNYSKYLLVGSLAVKIPGQTKFANRSFLINPDGKIIAQYDKIHLFDASINGGETHRESDRFIPGSEIICADTLWGKLGMSICYDVRFAHLYRTLAKNGAKFITVPAAFTKITGQAHWHVLLRARAIENGCFIIAPAQTGKHPSGRETFGHSLIVNPWGEVIADGGEDVGVVSAVIDLDDVTKTRQQMPSLEHDRCWGKTGLD